VKEWIVMKARQASGLTLMGLLAVIAILLMFTAPLRLDIETAIEWVIEIPGAVFPIHFIVLSFICTSVGWLWTNADASTRIPFRSAAASSRFLSRPFAEVGRRWSRQEFTVYGTEPSLRSRSTGGHVRAPGSGVCCH